MAIGRPRKEIDWQQFEKLCGIHCTLTEIAAWFSVSEDTIERSVKRQYRAPFAEIYRQKQSLGKTSLRRKMFETAMNGSVTMMIWLSKQMLGYSDKVEQTVEQKGEPQKPVINIIVEGNDSKQFYDKSEKINKIDESRDQTQTLAETSDL